MIADNHIRSELQNMGYRNVRLECSQNNITVTCFWVGEKDGKTNVIPETVVQEAERRFRDPFNI